MNKILVAILFVSLTTLNISCESRNKNKPRTKSSEYLLVTKVVDGDTFWADNDTKDGVKVRLIGIDAPESRKTSKKEVGYFGKEAKTYLTNLLSGKSVRLEYDLNRTDQYGRTLAYVYLQDGTFVNAELVKNGFAMTLTIPPNVKFANEFVKLQEEARENNRGLWKE
ncbi:MAG: thermonuclease family protein [Flavobacterium sp.]|nr:thermonuclease family protein [Flavobacterium sp.]